jgi:hypothetical protein
MALALSLNITQSNNALYLTVTDNAGTYNNPDNLNGWGSPNELVTNIVAETTTTLGKRHLNLDVVVQDKNGVTTTYDTINLYDHDSSGPFSIATDLTWTIDAADLVVSGTAMGAATDKLTDGIYTFTYTLQDASTAVAVNTYETSAIVDGDVRGDVYNKLRQVPTDYDCEENDRSRDIMEALLDYTYLQSMTASASVALQDEIINMLYTLDKLVSDGSKYTW